MNIILSHSGAEMTYVSANHDKYQEYDLICVRSLKLAVGDEEINYK